MKTIRIVSKSTFLCLCLFAGGAALAVASDISPELEANLKKRIELQRNPSIMIGVVDADGARYYGYGRLAPGQSNPPDRDTVYEIGSVTKTFTTTLLAEMALSDEVTLNDPVQKYLPDSVQLPEGEQQAITLESLATHRSGLPRLPDNLEPADRFNPYADYTVERLYDFLNRYELTREPGARGEYSNLGSGLLGHVLARTTEQDYATLMRERILQPLQMDSTSIALNDSQRARLAPPYAVQNGNLIKVKNWDVGILGGAGALRSTAADMLRYLSAEIGLYESSLSEAMELTHEPRHNFNGGKIGLGWVIRGDGGERLYWHNGGTGGYRAFAGFSKAKQRGVVVLTNSTISADDVGFHLLNNELPLAEIKAPSEREAVELPVETLVKLTGKFELRPEFVLTISIDDGQLFAQATGQPRLALYPETETDFFIKEVDAQITFQVDDNGVATALVLHQNGAHIPADKISN